MVFDREWGQQMGRRFVRLKCEFVQGKGKTYTYAFDFVIDGEKVVQGWDYVGFSKFKDKENRGAIEIYPFIIREDGEIDFGSGLIDSERFLSSNILTKNIRISETFTVNDGGENIYVIKEINGI